MLIYRNPPAANPKRLAKTVPLAQLPADIPNKTPRGVAKERATTNPSVFRREWVELRNKVDRVIPSENLWARTALATAMPSVGEEINENAMASPSAKL